MAAGAPARLYAIACGSPQSSRWPSPMERGVEQGADALAGERGRVGVGALDGEAGDAIEI
jgi:hypothetical protein